MNTAVETVVVAVMLAVVGLVVALLIFLGTLLVGAYSYEYRCTDEVAEKRLHIWWGMPVGGFDPIDGDPVGACDKLK